MSKFRQIKRRRYLRTLSERIKHFSKIIGKTTKRFLLLINLFLLILLHLSALAWYIPPYENVVPAYLGLGFLILFALNIIFLLLWIVFLKWKPALLCIVVLAFCWNPVSTYFPFHFKTKVIPENCIKIMTYNVMGFNWDTNEFARDKPIFEHMANSGADIICMQEFVINNQHYDEKGVISITEIDKILNQYPYRSIVRFGSAEGIYSFGIACYSKFPILKTTEIPIESEFNGAALYEININGKTVKLINVHLESNKLTSEDKQLYLDFIGSHSSGSFNQVSENIQTKLGAAYIERAKQAETIAEWISKQEGYSTVLCGDFNDTPISYTYKRIRGDKMVDSFAETGMGQGITYNRNMFWFRIDYIMHSKDIKSYNASVEKVMYSDHYSLTTHLQLPVSDNQYSAAIPQDADFP